MKAQGDLGRGGILRNEPEAAHLSRGLGVGVDPEYSKGRQASLENCCGQPPGTSEKAQSLYSCMDCSIINAVAPEGVGEGLTPQVSSLRCSS